MAARGPVTRPPTSRSYASIVRANVLTIFNAILGFFGVVTLAFADWRDALFLGILAANTAIGIFQEVRAKRALDRLSALVAPTATAVRDGVALAVPVEQVVQDDLLLVGPGDQVVADGELRWSDGLRLDESILTGESTAVSRAAGDAIRSGSFAVDGVGAFLVTAVGDDSYAARLADVARSFRHPRSPLELALDRLLLGLVLVMLPVAGALAISLWLRSVPTGEAAQTAVAGIVNLVPEGLILLTSLTFAVSAVRMARRGALAQQLNAVESLASVDTMCIDKTGTLTQARLQLVAAYPAAGVEREALGDLLGRYAAASPVRNATLAAIGEAYPREPRASQGSIPFSSRWRFSAQGVDGSWLILGAPEALGLEDLEMLAGEALRGRRALAFARSEGAPSEHAGMPTLPSGLEPLGLVVLSEQLRAEAREAVSCLREEGVHLVVLSGDSPATAGSIARDAGIGDGRGADGRSLPADPEALVDLVLAQPVVGRVLPDEKRRVVRALREQGRYVAMLGDGVNDVPALKEARLAIAQASGSQMARSVADIVLVSGDFASIPPMVSEGQKLLRNLQRVAKLFVSKVVFAGFVVLTVGLAPLDYPFLPRHLTLVTTLTIGIPGFFLALAPSAGRWSTEGFLREVVRFSLFSGTVIGAAVVGPYLVGREALDLPLPEARAIATTILLVLGLYLILSLEGSGRRRSAAVTALCAGMAALYVIALSVPVAQEFFELHWPGPAGLGLVAAGAVPALGVLALGGVRPGRVGRWITA